MKRGTCEHCGNEYVGKARSRYCSRTCHAHANLATGWYVSKHDGRCYVQLRDGSKQLYSRCLMEAHLRRSLGGDEIVHHVNGDKTDDRVENLAVVTRKEHVRLHVADMTHGTRTKRAKLTQEQVAAIKLSTERTSVLARQYGVTDGAITYHRGSLLKAHGRAA